MPNSTNIATLGVVGTDGVVPVYNPNGLWQWWSLQEIYTGTTGANKYVPKLNDYVMDPDTYTVYKVTNLDPVTLIATLTEVTPSFIPEAFTPADVLFGVGPGTQADTYRAYLDTSVTPYILAVDSRLYVGGTKASYAKIFLGSDLSATGTVISMVYDSSGNFVSQNVPLEMVALNTVTNYSWQTISVCNTNVQIPDGEIIVAVIYDAQGHVVSKRQLLVENTSFIRSVNVSQKYVTSIGLRSPFINSTTPNTINFPLNVPVSALNLQGIVNYSDGSSITLPIDGTKFNVIGLDQYVSTIVGQVIPLVLSYQLGSGEIAYNAVNGNTKYITAPYSIVTTNPDNSYDVKIFGYPEWQGSTIGYTMRFFMTNLDRNVWFDVTNQTQFASNTGVFNPLQFGYLQRKAVQLNLANVSPSFRPYVDTQLMDISLIQAPSVGQTPWTISQVSGTDIPAYGQNLYAKISSQTNYQAIDVSCGFTDVNTWLNNVYWATHPLVNTGSGELQAPTPTHFILMYGGQEYTFSINQFNQQLNIVGAFKNYSNVYLRFIKRTVTGDMILSIAGMIIYQIS
jgi:hypothetical protein